MARPKREWYNGAIYHVMNRGNRKADIFKENEDYIRFLEIIQDVRKKYAFTIHAICLMTNHFHMVLETTDTELWKIMKPILSVYAEGFNRRYECTGHLFQGRYKSSTIESEVYFLEVSRYIHLNPVKAFLVKNPASYEYSSYGLFVGLPADEPDAQKREVDRIMSKIVDTSRILSFFEENPRDQYRKFVEGKMSHEEHEKIIQKAMRENDMWLPM